MRKLTKIAAVVLSAVMTFSMAFAGDPVTIPESIKENDQWGDYVDLGKLVDDLTKVGTIETVIKGGKPGNGCVQLGYVTNNWGSGNLVWDTEDVSKSDQTIKENEDGTISLTTDYLIKTDKPYKEDEASPKFIKYSFQCWYGGPVEIVNLKLYDKDGKLLYAYKTDAPANDAPANDAPANDPPANDDKTGDATNVLALAGIACIALCGVAYASKKRA